MIPSFWIPWIGMSMTLGGLALFLLERRLLPRGAATFGLLLVLIGFILLNPVLFSMASSSQKGGAVFFLTTLGFFKLMSFFEGPGR
jgi:hypothetical protein